MKSAQSQEVDVTRGTFQSGEGAQGGPGREKDEGDKYEDNVGDVLEHEDNKIEYEQENK